MQTPKEHEATEITSLLLTQSPEPLMSTQLDSLEKLNIKRKLYISHSLYVWNARIYEFGIILFIINLYPNSLLQPSIFSLCCTVAGVFFTNSLTKIVNRGERLEVIKKTIFIQRSFAILSAVVLLLTFMFFENNNLVKHVSLGIVIICGVVETMSTIANKISISRDWIVKICGKDKEFLIELNTNLRSIDLFCKLVGPFFISTFLSLTSHQVTAVFFIVSFLVSSQVEFTAILGIYNTVPKLQNGSHDHNLEVEPPITAKGLTFWQEFKIFSRTPLSMFVIAVSMTYFTVLSFGGSTVAYLLSFDDISNFSIGVLKSVSTIFELFSVAMFPHVASKLGLINTGLVAITFEFLALVPIAAAFILKYEYTRWVMCVCIPLSRIGLWSFDLALQNSIQLYIEDDFERFNVTSFEEICNNSFLLLGYVSTLIFNKPEQFAYPSLATVSAIGSGMILCYIWYFIMRAKKIIFE